MKSSDIASVALAAAVYIAEGAISFHTDCNAVTNASWSKTANTIEPARPRLPLEKERASGEPQVNTGALSLCTAQLIC